MKCSEFSDLLKLQNLSKLKSYLNNHRLSESDEYQMVVTLAMDLEDERKAEKIICDYIRRYGLSPKAKQALIDLNFTSALKLLCSLNAEPEEIVDLCSDEISIAQRLKDGFLMLSDDEITEEFC